MASGGLGFRNRHWICRAPPRIAMGRERRCRDGQRQDLALLVRGRHTQAGSFILRASPERGLMTATTASFLMLKRRVVQIQVGRFTPAGSHVRCQRRYFHVCRSENRRKFRRVNEWPNERPPVDAAIAILFYVAHHWRGTTEAGFWAPPLVWQI